MNPGAFLVQPGLLSRSELDSLASLAQAKSVEKESVHRDGKYAHIRWFEVPMNASDPVCAKVLKQLDVSDPELMVLYYLEPGAKIHPHRDLTGAGLNNRIRFHVPIITNDNVDFRVSHERIVMAPGELWCLDTSYLHSVENAGSHTRVHLVIECALTPELRRIMPSGIKPALHNVAFVAIMASKFTQSVLVNSIRDPRYFKAQMGMIAKFIAWRVLKVRKPG